MLKNEVGSVGDAAKRSGEKVSAAFSGAKINKTLENARHKVEQLEEQLRNLSTKHKFAIAADDDKGASKVGAQMERVYDELAEARRKLALEVEAAAQREAAAEEKNAERATKAAQKEALAVRRAQEKQAKEALKPVRRFESRMREIVSGALVFNVASSALRSMTEYFGSALMANQEFSESVAGLRGSLLTAFQPVYEAVVPALSTLINWLNTATQVVARFFAAISGKSYKQMQENADALKDQADGLESVGGAAKKAQRDLAGFDEINRLSGKDTGGGGGGTLNPPTFEEVEIPSSWEATIESLAMRVKDIFFTWDDLTPEIVAEKIVTSLGAVCGGFIGFSLGGPGGALIGMAIGAGLGVVLSNIVFNGDGQLTPDEILAALVAALLTLGGAAVGFAVGGPGGAALGATIGLGLTFTILDATFNDIDKNYNDLAEKVIEWSDNMARTTETGFIIPTYDDMKKLTDQIKEFFKGSSDDIIKNFDRTAILTEAGFVMPTHDEMKQLADKIKQFFEGASDDIIENFDRTAMLTESGFVVPTREEMEATAKLIKQKFSEAKDGIVSKWVMLSGWFKENVANPISNCFSNLGASIRGAWEKTFNWITDKLDSLVKFFNSVFGDGTLLNYQTTGTVPASSYALQTSFASRSIPEIPMLAKGAVIPPNAPFMAVLGDQRNGTNIEAPLSTIQEAVAIVMEDVVGGMMAGFEALIEENRRLRETVEDIEIGDETIGKASKRYQQKLAIARGR